MVSQSVRNKGSNEMNVLVVSPKYHPIVGGGETFALDAVEQLRAVGINIVVATEPIVARNTATYKYKVYEVEGLSDTSIDVIKAADGLYRLIDEFKPDIIHAHGYFALLALGLSNGQGIPIVASIHSTPVWRTRIIGGMSDFEQEVIFAQQIFSLSKPKVITAANDVYATAAKKLVDNKVPVEYMPYPILPDFFATQDRNHFRDIFGLRESDILITVPSRIIERKGIKEAVEAMQYLNNDFHLCLPSAIQPLDKKYWQKIIASPAFQNVRKRIIIPDRAILHNDMPKLYAASDVILMPSYYEGAPVATVEAMAANKAFIGANSQGINGFIKHQHNGLLVPPKDSESIAKAITALSQDPELSARLTKEARKTVADLTWKVQLPRLLSIFKANSAKNT